MLISFTQNFWKLLSFRDCACVHMSVCVCVCVRACICMRACVRACVSVSAHVSACLCELVFYVLSSEQKSACTHVCRYMYT